MMQGVEKTVFTTGFNQNPTFGFGQRGGGSGGSIDLSMLEVSGNYQLTTSIDFDTAGVEELMNFVIMLAVELGATES